MDEIIKIFTTEDKTEMKQAFKEIVKEQFQSQLEEMDIYLFDPGIIEKMIEEAFSDVITEIKLVFKVKLREQMLAILENSDIEKLLTLKKKVK